ncbi:MAG: hypothetical protein ABIY55_07140 [Kofleriaceae bacterium]
MTDSRDPKPWLWRGLFLAVLVFGWLFVAWQNHFHISAPLVFVCFGYLAVVTTVANLWRTGAAAVTGDEQENDSTWAKPAGALGELEREKRTLLKAIKEAEFDHQMGKLSKLDVDDMIRTYRARAIEVIKEIDRLETGAIGTPREQIMREVRARIELEDKSQRKPDPKAATFVPSNGDAKVDANGDAKAAAKADPKIDARDEGMDADSTTSVEPKRNDAVKEATP